MSPTQPIVTTGDVVVAEEAGGFWGLAAVADADDDCAAELEAEPAAGRLGDPAVWAPDEHPPSKATASRSAVQMIARRITGTVFLWGVVDECGCAISVYLTDGLHADRTDVDLQLTGFGAG